MKYLFFCALLCLVAFSCENNAATSSATETEMTDPADQYTPAEIAAQTNAYEDMIDAHDRVMPKMGAIASMQQNIKVAKEKMPEMAEKLDEANNKLESAYDGMMVWMRELKSVDDLRELGSQEKIMAHVEAEMSKMKDIENGLNDGMATARELLGIEAVDASHDHDGHDHDHGSKDHKHEH